MQTSKNSQAHQSLARAWALLDRAEWRARQAVQAETGPSLWLLAANSIQRARDSLEAIYPTAPHSGSVGPLPDDTCRDLVRAAAEQLNGIPHGYEPEGLWLALVHLTEAEQEVDGRFGP